MALVESCLAETFSCYISSLFLDLQHSRLEREGRLNPLESTASPRREQLFFFLSVRLLISRTSNRLQRVYNLPRQYNFVSPYLLIFACVLLSPACFVDISFYVPSMNYNKQVQVKYVKK